MPFYLDDYLKICNYDETEYDQKVSPYYNIETAMQIRKDAYAKTLIDGQRYEAAELRPHFEEELVIAAGREVEDGLGDEAMV